MVKEFCKKIEKIDYSKNLYEVFNDFLSLSTLALSAQFDKKEEKEQEYLQICKKYKKIDGFIDLFCTLTNELEKNPFQDFLGTVYQTISAHNKNLGQFFTPLSVSCMMAKVSLTDTCLEKPFITMNEPTCGSGANIIAYAKAIKEKDFNPQHKLFFIAQDLDEICCKMCYLQTSLIGLSGVVIQGDTLMNEYKVLNFTPGSYSNYWQDMFLATNIFKILEEIGPKNVSGVKGKANKQLTLF